MALKDKHKVIIAGAGPAGITASLELCRHQIPHMLLEKNDFPKDKICGDAVSGKALDVMKKLDGNILESFFSQEHVLRSSYGVKFIAPNGRELDLPFSSGIKKQEHAPGFISRRIHFDQFLFNRIDFRYCQFKPRTRLTGVRRENGSVVAECRDESSVLELESNLIIGAEGDRSVVAKQLSGSQGIKDKKHYSAGIRCYFRNVTGMEINGLIELHFLKDLLPGYFWIFPLSNNEANVGIGVPSDTVSRKKLNLRAKLKEIIRTHPVISRRFQEAVALEEPAGWGLPLASSNGNYSADHMLLTGDAASLIDPFTGEGIGNAMLSGYLAGQHAAAAVKVDRYDGGFLQAYTDELNSKLNGEIKISDALQKLSRYGWLFNFVIRKASGNKKIQELITGMFEDVHLREQFKKPAFYFKLLFS